MTYNILSSEINPYVRFADLRDGKSNLYVKNAYARDCRLFYFIRGELCLFAGGEETVLKPGDALLLPPLCPYRAVSEKDCAFYLINYDYMLTPKTPERALPISFSPDCEPVQTVNFKDIPRLAEPLKISVPGLEPLFFNMSLLYSKKTFYYKTEMNAYLSLALSRIFESVLSNKNDKPVSKIIEYVNLNYTKPLTNRAVGEHFHYHPNYISRLFLRHTGLPLHKYLINYRIDKAITMMISGTESIAEIAAKTGWNSAAHFSGYFKKITGCPPSCFREKNFTKK